MTTPQRESATTDRNYGGVPTHERIAARRSRLIAAGRELFGTQGVAATTVRGTCDASGLSQRYFYESFRSVEALAIAVADQISNEVISAAFDAVDGVLDARVRAYTIFKVLVDYIAADPGAGRIMFIESAGNGADFAVWRREMLVRAAALNEIWFRESTSTNGRASDGTLDDRIASLVITGGVVEAVVAWLERDIDATPDQLARALGHAVGAWSDGSSG